MNHRSIILHLILFLVVAFFYSGMSYAQNSSLTFQHFTPENGLVQDRINCINQDKDGFIWIFSYSGISLYDGHSLKPFQYFVKDTNTFDNTEPNCVFRDHKNRMWIYSGYNIIMYDYSNGKIKSFNKEESYKKKLNKYDITALTEDENGNIWIGTRLGLFEYQEDKNEFTQFLHDTLDIKHQGYYRNRITDLLPDHHGNIWLGTLYGLYKFSLTTHQFIQPYKVDYNPNIRNDRIVSEEFDKKGNIWISIFDNGIKILDTSTNKVSIIDVKNSNGRINSNQIVKILCDDDGNMWIAHDTKGINIYFNKTKRFESFRHDESDAQSLIDDRINTLFKDKFGMIWIGTQTEGVDRVSRVQSKFNTLKYIAGKLNSPCENGILCACEDSKGNLWIGSQTGLMYFDRSMNIFTCYHHEDNNSNSLSDDNINAIAIYENRFLWIGTNNGLNVYDIVTKKWKHYFHDDKNINSISSEVISNICISKNGKIWFGTNNVISRYQPDGDYFENRTNNKNIGMLPRAFYTSIFEDSRNTMWIATSRSGVYNLDSTFKVIKKYRVDTTRLNNIPSNTVNNFAEDKEGNIWIATDVGIVKLNRNTQKFIVYTTADGLSSNKINQVRIMPDGIIWVATNAGLSEIFIDSKGKIIVKNFNSTDGLQSNLFYIGASLILKTGELFFGGSKGFNIFYPKDIVFNNFIPDVQISSFKIFDKEIGNLSQSITQKKIKLVYKQNFFSFDMAAISYDYPEKNKFAYQLEGFDKEMIYCGSQYHVSYTSVPPGIYTLHVIASNNDGIWNNEGLRMQIEITPPFWMTWWFRIITIGIIIVSFTMVVRFISTRKLRKQLAVIEQQREIENIRSRISRDIHDEIGSGLTRISVLGEMMKSDIGEKQGNVSSTINKIISSSREITGNLSEIVWTINPQYDNLQSILSYMRNYSNKFFEDSSITCKVDFSGNVPSIHVNPDIKRNLFLVLKESLNNIMKHSHAKNAFITFEINDKNFRFIIADDGAGIDESRKHEFGNGLRNIQTRMQSINASCHIKSETGKGTTITIEGTLKEKISKA